MNTGPSQMPPLDGERFREALARCTPADFDGHTRFAELTPEQRLEWLAAAARFIAAHKGTCKSRGKVDFGISGKEE